MGSLPYLCAGFLFSAFPRLRALSAIWGNHCEKHVRGWFKWKMALWELPDNISGLYGDIMSEDKIV